MRQVIKEREKERGKAENEENITMQYANIGAYFIRMEKANAIKFIYM
ncbi:MAG: hypothetical protein P8O89_06205 [Polaribacter sp.]|nr:hypothetical protein [Polaribacter sp.]